MKRTATGTLLAGAVIGFSASAAIAGAPGARPGDTSVAQIRTEAAGHTPLLHGKACKLKGVFSNDYGGTFTMGTSKCTNARRPCTYSAPYCASPWTIARNPYRPKTMFSISGTYTGTDGCQNFTELMTWENVCEDASGTFTNAGGTTGPDTWDRETPDHRPVK